MAVERGEVSRLIVMMPPRHSKSETTTVKFSSWYLGRNPDKRVIIASHTAALALRFSMRARNDFTEFAPEVWGFEVNPDSSAMYRWDVHVPGRRSGTPPGGVIAAGVGGPITGHGADLAIIDDPLKDAEQAASKIQRDAIWDWYRYVLRTRLQPGAAVVLVLTRWHEDDLAGRLLAAAADDPQADQWTVLRLPALAEENDPLGREPGKPLWPEQYGEAALAQIRASVGSQVWAALYQQRPQPAGGTIFQREWFRYFRTEGEFYVLRRAGGEHRVKRDDCWRFQTVDLAASLKSSADYFVIQTWVVTPERDLLLLDLLRTRVEGPQQLGLLKQQYHRHRPSFIGIERAGYQLTMLQTAIREGLPARELKADRDKVSRALTIAARYEAGAVYHRAGAPWLQDYEDELLAFPRGGHDDMVDCAGYAGLVLADTAKRVIDKVVVV